MKIDQGETTILSLKKINIDELKMEIAISEILRTIEHCDFHFLPIISHNLYNPTNTIILDRRKTPPHIMIEKPLRNLVQVPITDTATVTTDIIDYLKTTAELLLEHQIYTPLTPETIRYDMTNKIPIVVDFRKAIMITKWQNIETFRKAYAESLASLAT